MRIIIGLGNPGKEYAGNRHNVGFNVLDRLLGAVKWENSKRFNCEIYRQGDCLYAKPLSFMNKSGEPVRKILAYYQLLPKALGLFKKTDADLSETLLVIHDDIDQALGKYRWANDSGSGGHNGIKSIINHLKTQKFRRLKIGVANEKLRQQIPAERFVLTNFSDPEKNILNETIDCALKELKNNQ
jgi:PTH1 family peptidyl-tRNA hydrolase